MMQEVSVPVGDARDNSQVSVGGALRMLRQAKGWSLDEVSSRIKFSPRQIAALENEQWNELPSGISLRGLVRNYARAVGADEQALVAALEPDARAVAPARLVHGPLHDTGTPVGGDEDRASAPWGWIIAILVVLLAAVAYAFWQGWLPQSWIPAWLSGLGR
jgi:cytoskeletal protein RodZ